MGIETPTGGLQKPMRIQIKGEEGEWSSAYSINGTLECQATGNPFPNSEGVLDAALPLCLLVPANPTAT